MDGLSGSMALWLPSHCMLSLAAAIAKLTKGVLHSDMKQLRSPPPGSFGSKKPWKLLQVSPLRSASFNL